jgi:hypothetical protein
MAEPKTRPTGASVPDFLAALPSEERRKDCETLARMMRRVTGAPARMWGPSIVGFAEYTLTYADGRTLEWPALAFSPRVQTLTVYLCEFKRLAPLLAKLGKHKLSGRCCLYIRSLADVDLAVLERILEESRASLRQGPSTAASSGASTRTAARTRTTRAGSKAAPARRATHSRVKARPVSAARRRTASRAG